MLTKYLELAEFLRLLEASPDLDFRLVALRDGHDWKTHTLVFEHLPEAARTHISPEPILPEMDYGVAYFAAGRVDGRTASRWLRGNVVELPSAGQSGAVRRCVLPSASSQVNWTRAESYALLDHTQTPVPLNRYDATTTAPRSLPYLDGFLLADGLPFYADLKTAILRYAYGVTDPERIQQATVDPRVLARLADTTAWLSHITLSPTSIVARVAGTDLSSIQLTISGATGVQFQQRVQEEGAVECLLPNGIPNPLWIVLSRGADWTDYFHRDERWPFGLREQRNVTVDIGDPSAEIAALIAQGEGLTTEFKADVPTPHDQMLKTIAAFANGAGGVLLLGVKDKTGELVGCSDNPDDITQMIRNTVFPDPLPRIEVVVVEGRRILAIYVQKGAAPPYGLHPTNTRYYVRRGATTFPARPEELRAIVLASHEPVTTPFADYLP